MKELRILYPKGNWKPLHLKDFIIYMLLLIITVSFMSHVLTRVYYLNEFRHEFVVKVQPKGIRYFPSKPHYRMRTLPYENHKVIIKNGRVVYVERLGLAFTE